MKKNRIRAVIAAAFFLLVNVVLWNVVVFFENKSVNVFRKTPVKSPVDFSNQLQNADANGIVGDVASGMLTGLSTPSLEMRENVDSLLTPAILVQECISEDAIILYPNE